MRGASTTLIELEAGSAAVGAGCNGKEPPCAVTSNDASVATPRWGVAATLAAGIAAVVGASAAAAARRRSSKSSRGASFPMGAPKQSSIL